ncbi:MAG: type III pantothenate kinase [Akkermansiaceae bacterium]
MNLLIDNSNTRTKFALHDETSLFEWRAIIPTSEITRDRLSKELDGIKYDSVTLCSVVPEAAETIESFFEKKPLHRITSDSNMPISIEYPKPEQVGADRLANSAAAFLEYKGPAIVIDFGTAVTFDVISKEGAYIGGVIAPGTAALRDYLHRKTALLPAIKLKEPKTAIGQSTKGAMLTGAVIGYRGLVREILTAVSAELEGDPTIIATGGDASLISSGLEAIEVLDPDLTLRGIQAIGRINQNF